MQHLYQLSLDRIIPELDESSLQAVQLLETLTQPLEDPLGWFQFVTKADHSSQDDPSLFRKLNSLWQYYGPVQYQGPVSFHHYAFLYLRNLAIQQNTPACVELRILFMIYDRHIPRLKPWILKCNIHYLLHKYTFFQSQVDQLSNLPFPRSHHQIHRLKQATSALKRSWHLLAHASSHAVQRSCIVQLPGNILIPFFADSFFIPSTTIKTPDTYLPLVQLSQEQLSSPAFLEIEDIADRIFGNLYFECNTHKYSTYTPS